MPDIPANASPVVLSLQLVSARTEGEKIIAMFDDDTTTEFSYANSADFFNDPNQYKEMIRRMLVLDWLQEQVMSKRALFDVSNPSDIWVQVVP
jgi:hypothetical protein